MHSKLKYYDLILASFVGALIISNIAAVKLIDLGPVITDGGAILFPLTYIFGDIITEVYGYKYARRAIWTVFAIMAIGSLVFLIVGALPPSEDWGNQEAWDAILGFVPRIVLASLVAFLFGQFINSLVLAKMKLKYGKDKMWTRLIGSTFFGQLIDTTIFGLIAFSGIIGPKDMLIFILFGWAFKTTVEIIMLPITYRAISYLKTNEHKDAIDKKTNFNPFSTEI